MCITPQNLIANSKSPNHHLLFNSSHIHVESLKTNPYFLTTTTLSLSSNPQFEALTHKSSNPWLNCYTSSPQRRRRAIRVGATVQRAVDDGDRIFDAFLSIVEVLCLVPSVVISIGGVGWYVVLGSKKAVMGVLGEKVFVWWAALLVGAVVVGGLIRRRQWRRICRDMGGSGGGESCNVVYRVERLEEDLKSSVAIIRVLSRQLEKLGIRFRVTRKALKEPLSETAALAQKNSEATRALAIQEDLLEKELGEIQKVLLAMQ
ncbi:hypothetical protein GIB67_031395, partial [Kingdonia uniflora]